MALSLLNFFVWKKEVSAKGIEWAIPADYQHLKRKATR
jgi:hypothetical protein